MKTCQTPEANYTFHTQPNKLSIRVTNLPLQEVTEEEAIQLENDLHDALENVLKRLYCTGNEEVK